MQSKLYPLAVLGTTLMVTLTTQSSIAFNIIGPTESYVPSVLAPVGNKRIDILLEPKSVKSIKLGGTNGLLNVLRRAFPSWTFLRAPKEKELKGNFEIKTYKACGPLTPCQPGLETPQIGGVGAYLSLDYNPVGDDPNPVTDRVYWIQRVKSNHKGGSVTHGTVENIIDINPGQKNPFYSKAPFFSDSPYRIDPLNNHDWFAELYLVKQKPGTKTVTIYNGIQWGWKNTVTRRKEPVPVPVPVPDPTPDPIPFPFIIPEWLRPKTQPFASSASGGGGIGYVAVSPSPTPRPIPSPTPRPSPSPTPWTSTPWTSTPWTSTPWTSTPWTSTPWTSTPWTSTPWTSTPWTSSPLGSTSSTVVVSTSTTITSPSPFPKPSSPAPSPRPAPATSSGGRPIQAAPLSAISKGNAANLRSSSLFESSSKANTDYLSAISSDLLEDPELSSTSSNLNNAKVAGVSRDLLENPELSSTDNNENQVNLADISSDLLEDSELSSTNNNENQVNLAGISSDLLEDPELSSTDSNENNADIESISADLLQDQELSSEDNNENQADLADISADLLEDPELSYIDDTLIATTQNISSKNTDDDALSAEAVPEPTTALGTLLALAVLPVIKRLTNRKTKE